jgi:hypothetical protein
VGAIADYAVSNEILTLQELKEIAADNCDKDLRNGRGFLEACRVNLGMDDK